MNIEEFPFPKIYWARPDAQSQGDADADAIYAAVGRALSTWELLEMAAVDLFVLFVQSYSPAAKRAYGSIISASGRRDTILAAAETCFLIHKVTEADALKIRRFVEHWAVASGRRNDIAHGVVTRVSIGEKERGHFLRPADYNTNKNRATGWFTPFNENDEFWFMHGDYRYTKNDIEHFTARFGELNHAGYYVRLHFIRTYPLMWKMSLPPMYPQSGE
jgi:hypothetical protein